MSQKHIQTVEVAPAQRLTDQFEVDSPDELPEAEMIDDFRDDHPALRELGSINFSDNVPEKIVNLLSDAIYDADEKAVREILQNSAAACARRAKANIRQSDQYPDGWLELERWRDAESGEVLVRARENPEGELNDGEEHNIRVEEVPRPLPEVFDAASNVGYEPTIIVEFHRDDSRLVVEDNGDGMDVHTATGEFMQLGESGSGIDVETGGQFGIGSNSSSILHGPEGFMSVESIPMQNPEDGWVAESTLYSLRFLPGEPNREMAGTTLNIPLKSGFTRQKGNKVQDWVRLYSQQLNVPVLYREYRGGSETTEEEYTPSNIFEGERFDNAPVKIEMPGAFRVVAGPDVIPYTSYNEPDPEDTFLVNMPIERNGSSDKSTLWDFVVTILDEQGRIVSGPNAGRYKSDLDVMHEDDVPLPEPDGSRDSLKKQDISPDFWDYVGEIVREEEMSRMSEIIRSVKDNGVVEKFEGDIGSWKLFSKLLSKYGPYRVKSSRSKLQKFINGENDLPDIDDETADRLICLFDNVSHVSGTLRRGKKKRGRTDVDVGKIVTKPGEVYMAGSTGGNFIQYGKVVNNTHDEVEIVAEGKYNKYGDKYGWKKLKEVPLKQSDDHEFNVPDSVHAQQVQKEKKRRKKQKQKRKKADNIEDITLKLRTDSLNSSIDSRLTVKRVRQILEKGNSINGKNNLIIYGKGPSTKNISDNYSMAKYAAIASAKKDVFEHLSDLDNVFRHDEFVDWSANTTYDTPEGEKTPEELINDDRVVVLVHNPENPEERLLGDSDEAKKRRQLWCEDIMNQQNWGGILDKYRYSEKPDDCDIPDPLLAVGNTTDHRRARYVFNEEHDVGKQNILGLKENSYMNLSLPFTFHKLSQSEPYYDMVINTPNWDDDSDVYRKIPSRDSDWKRQLWLALHDLGINPIDHNPEEIRDIREFINANED